MRWVILSLFAAGFFMACEAQGPDTLWTHSYWHAQSDVCYAVHETRDGGFILGGTSGREGTGRSINPYFVKTNSDGDTMWTREFWVGDGSMDRYIVATRPTSDGGYIAGGVSFVFSPPYYWFEALLMRMDSTGDTLWTETYKGSRGRDALCWDVRELPDGGFVWAGGDGWFLPDRNVTEMLLCRVNSDGDTLWNRIYGIDDPDTGEVAMSLAIPPDNGYVLAGTRTSWVTGRSQVYVVRADSVGQMIWESAVVSEGLTDVYAMDIGSDNGIAVAGGTRDSSGLPWDVLLLKLDTEGEVVWRRRYETPQDDQAHAMCCTSDGGYLLAGYTAVDSPMDVDVRVVKCNSEGGQEWSVDYGGPYGDVGRCMDLTSDGGCIIAGWRWDMDTYSDEYYAIRLARSSHAAELGWGDPALTLAQNYPNPFNANTRVAFTLPSASRVSLDVFDVIGRCVFSIAPSFMSAGSHEFALTCNGWPSGTYWYHLKAGPEVLVRRMVLVR